MCFGNILLGIFFGFEEENLYYEDGDTWEKISQRVCGCSTPGSIQGLVGMGSEPPGPVEHISAHGSGVGIW